VRADDGTPESGSKREAGDNRQTTAVQVQDMGNLVGTSAITVDGEIDIDQLNSAVAVVRSAVGHGSGFVVSKGLVLTNEHVVGGATKVRLIFGDGAQIDAEVAAVDDVRDVALIRFADSFIRPALAIRTTAVKIGEDVYSFGAPLDEEFSGTLRKGIISAHREIRDLNYLQSDAAINPGNSGGPLIDQNGNVVGIAVSGIMIAGVAEQGINFFIPISEAVVALGL
ncbi:MAG: trypsin-like peptidase domain-containing protein, partial [Chloroflexi bacterium]|nr:trypsin-like peptidase domain-containing protein [Chloroflexota bacterium]